MTDSILPVIKNDEYWHNKVRKNRNNVYSKEQYSIALNLPLSLIRKGKKHCNKITSKAKCNSEEIGRIMNFAIKLSPKYEVLLYLSTYSGHLAVERPALTR